MEFVTHKIFEHALNTPDKPAIAWGESCVCYKELASMVYGVAETLKRLGLRQGDRVVHAASPDADYAFIVYGIHLAGCVNVPLEKGIPAERLNEIASELDPALIISSLSVSEEYRRISRDELLESARAAAQEWSVDTEIVFPADDIVGEIIFTTGSTGKSKGVMQTRDCLRAYVETMNAAFELRDDTVLLVCTPMNHAGGLHRMHMILANGSTLVLIDGLKDLKQYYKTVYRWGVNALYLPPSGVHILLVFSSRELTELDSRMQFIFTASAPYPEADKLRMRELFPTTRLLEAYGGSEVGSVCTYNYNTDVFRKNCVGKPYPNVKLRFEGEDNVILISSPMLMKAYLNAPELTASVFDGEYFRTSDSGYLDGDGYLIFTGRVDDVINVGGMKVAPTEVENAALKLEYIQDCACTSVSNPVTGTAVKLLAVIKPGYEFSPKKIAADLRPLLESYKLPSVIQQTDSIPKLFNGKIDRKTLRRPG